tara:strand:- start:19 stop:714 length:696 start_codon:yes stop_codon:yes gene_type:complete
MVLNKSMRNMLVAIQGRQHYENDLKPISGGISELFGREEMYIRDRDKISSKSIKVKSKSSKSSDNEFVVEKLTEEISSEEDNDDDDNSMSDKEMSDIKEENKDLNVSISNDIVYVEPEIKDTNLLVSEFVDQSGPINDNDMFGDVDIDIEGKDIVEEEDKGIDIDIVEGKSDKLDHMFFDSLDKLNNKPNLTQIDTQIISDNKPKEISGGNVLGGGPHVKKIQLTEKYDFF